MKPGDSAWITLAVGVVAYEVAATIKGWDLLSQACDNYRRTNPILTYTVLAYIPLHLTRVWPQRIDPLTQLANRLGR